MVINQTWLFLFCFIRGWALLVFSLSIFCKSVFFSLLVGPSPACFPFAPLFPFVCTFLSEDLSFPTTFFGFVSTFAGAGLVDNLARSPLRLLLPCPLGGPRPSSWASWRQGGARAVCLRPRRAREP